MIVLWCSVDIRSQSDFSEITVELGCFTAHICETLVIYLKKSDGCIGVLFALASVFNLIRSVRNGLP